MNECLTYADFLFVIDAFEPLCTFLLLFAGYGVINLLPSTSDSYSSGQNSSQRSQKKRDIGRISRGSGNE